MLYNVGDISGEYKKIAISYLNIGELNIGELKPRTINSVKSKFRKVIPIRQLRR